VYNFIGEYLKVLSFLEKALEIEKKKFFVQIRITYFDCIDSYSCAVEQGLE
jgi:hypothetical protein